MSDNKLIGLYGGAFDPIHNAHISIAQNCIKKIGLNKIIFIPTGNSPTYKNLTAHHHRLEMLNIICKNNNFEISDFEIKEYINQKKVSYTLNTLKYFKKNIESTLIFILGADVFSTINKWHKWKEILNYCHLVLVDRTSVESDINNMPNEVKIFFNDNVTNDINDLMKNDQGKIYPIQMSMFDESSSQIRDRLKKNLDIKDLIPKPIHDYILQNSLYNLPGHNK
ncbi:nicotinate (nicotinamide) nucleotide adenylyltransferase [Methylophilaceae bacterium]|jgi:nicotinate-nucleotide adenylyltransferase|nr:nicotinate (nicotinamide) nucleotide adenylyltransferase [Methylophilaceae bacterium]|tara:strand:+ start:580 stop:1251 length:672 start_codon:yes stop_codon:yes gene_type:complete